MTDDLRAGLARAALEPPARSLGDALRPAGADLGTTVAGLVHVSTAPFRAIIWGYQQVEEILIPIVCEKVEKIKRQNRIKADPNIIGSTLEAAKFHLSSREMSELFASLIASAHDASKANKIHPSFTYVIQQLSSEEASAIKYFWEECCIGQGHTPSKFPVISFDTISEQAIYTSVRDLTELIFLDCVANAKASHAKNTEILNSLSRQGLIQILYDGALAPTRKGDPYDRLLKHPLVVDLANRMSSEGYKIRARMGHGIITQFGHAFMTSVFDAADS